MAANTPWWIQMENVAVLLERQPTFIISQAVFLAAGIITLRHAFQKGGRWPYFWLGTVLHGLYAYNFWHFVLPEYDNFWHSQTPIMFLGGRLPLHIICLYPAFIYQAAFAVSRLDLPAYAEPFAVGLLTVLIDIPYDIVAVKFVHWTWHDTDPNIFDRHYWVPWNSYYFHASFTASFVYFFNASRTWFKPRFPQRQSPLVPVEWMSLMIATVFGMPGGVMLFVPIYHILHDALEIHAEVTFFLLFSIFAAFTMYGILSERDECTKKLTTLDYVLIIQLAVHYLIYWIFVVFFDPAKEISVGLHEPVGPCNETIPLITPFGKTLYKRKYFCPHDYDEGYFDFHCANKPFNDDIWYTICGTPFHNRAEYIAVLTSILIVAAGVFRGIYFAIPIPKPVARKLKYK
ncbi:uncharacterized protein LOC123880655 [Maniola jurtina]|uniref:uncharacterized protein LOC123880655 n=1 Tax=Maniola jurtina TaxID=191418 RepID=UPI001E689517|nr:uncharacterized protein LOC123880655 [Maniola jurtina]